MKSILLSALLLGSVAVAADYNYEVSPLIGYNFAEGNIDVDDYLTFGAELQYNGFDSVIKPELSVFYSKADYNIPAPTSDTDVLRIALNGVYEFDEVATMIPFAKIGAGYENMGDANKGQTGNTNSVYVDAGFGAKIPFTEQLALKLETIYMLKDNDRTTDNNLAVLAGLTYAFGAKAQKAAPVVAEEEQEVVAVDGDDDKDGILNSKDRCLTTPSGKKVDALGCAIPVAVVVEKKIDNDIDKDGVVNADDICPNTPMGESVNSDGCPVSINLEIQFENNSAKITPESEAHLSKYADFLKKYTNYTAEIVGHTDSKGSEAYNQKLSQKRAETVVSDLVARGVDAKQLSSKGEGELNPIATNDTKEGRQANRRIEAKLTRN
jgi:OOP family OmpA-OmpF porin